MLANSTMNSWLFPPQTREVQFDEKWAFVGKKEKNCNPDNPDDATLGDNWDHVALDAEHKLVVSVVPGKRIKENIQALVNDFKQRTSGRMINLITTDEYAAYPDAILQAYGIEVVPERTDKPGRPAVPYQIPPPNLTHATVHKTRTKGRVVKVDCRVVFGIVVAVRAALAMSMVSKAVNTSFVERHKGTDRDNVQDYAHICRVTSVRLGVVVAANHSQGPNGGHNGKRRRGQRDGQHSERDPNR